MQQNITTIQKSSLFLLIIILFYASSFSGYKWKMITDIKAL